MEREQLLIDTSVLIDHLRKRQKDHTRFYRATFQYECLISAVTEFEFRVGMTPNNRQFSEDVLRDIPVLPFDSGCVKVASDIYQDLKERNQLISLPDVFIAATAIVHDLAVVTRNVDDFERAGIAVINPWKV